MHASPALCFALAGTLLCSTTQDLGCLYKARTSSSLADVQPGDSVMQVAALLNQPILDAAAAVASSIRNAAASAPFLTTYEDIVFCSNSLYTHMAATQANLAAMYAAPGAAIVLPGTLPKTSRAAPHCLQLTTACS